MRTNLNNPRIKLLITIVLSIVLIALANFDSFFVSVFVLIIISLVGLPISLYADRKTQDKKNLRLMSNILEIVLGASVINTGYSCLADWPREVHNFHEFGYSNSFRYFIGAAEILGGIGLVIKRFTIAAAFGLCIIMLGAIYSHIKINDGINFLGSLFYLISLSWIIFIQLKKYEKINIAMEN